MELLCSDVRNVAINARQIYLQFRLLVALVFLLIINIFLERIQTKIIPRLAVYKHLQPETRQEIGMRVLQVVFGPIISISGYGFLLFQAISGCNAMEIYLFFIGGISLLMVDVHEFVRRWPLKPVLLFHHIMTFVLGLAFVEFQVLPSNDEKIISWSSIFFISNIGAMWTVDFFHVIYRVSNSLSVIKNARKIYLFLALVRIFNIILLAIGVVGNALQGGWFGSFCLLSMALAYTYNSLKAITFVKNFDCKRYYDSHQATWFEETEKESHRQDTAHSSEEV